jgi:DNA-binding MarR family transcriptional regulator
MPIEVLIKMQEEHLPKHVYEQLANFRYKIRKFIHFSEKAARKVGITPQSHQLLLAIKGFPDREFATPSELAERLQITHHACVGLIKRCELSNLVNRQPNPEDGRSILISLTNEGAEILEKLSEIHLAEMKRIGLWGIEP